MCMVFQNRIVFYKKNPTVFKKPIVFKHVRFFIPKVWNENLSLQWMLKMYSWMYK